MRDDRSLNDLAIVGMACRFPGATGLDEYWRLLGSGVDALRTVPADRWDIDAFYDPDPAAAGKMNCRTGGFVDGIERFDADFFAVSPREAAQLDPRQRMILETGWEALEDAGIAPDRLAGTTTGVFVASLAGEYLYEPFARRPDKLDAYSGAGGAESVIANRLSYALDLRGPSLTVDTACSGSLVALHLAAQSLRQGECEMALVGGVNLILEPGTNVFFTKAGILSPDGCCRPFDHRANGTVRSDGAGMVVVKPLAAARRDGDRIYAVVLGTAINHNGRSNGLMAPSAPQQAALLREACRRAGVAPADIQYVEAHGTGTRLGDPIEVEAIAEVYGAGRDPGQACTFGSVKAVLGHMEAAAGVAGLIKVALALHHRRIPGTPHFERLNPLISIGDTPLQVQAEPGDWPSPERPLLAGVSSFGLGGANAHAVLEAAPPPAAGLDHDPGADLRPQLLAFSARHPAALRELACRYRALLADPARGSAADVCRAAARRRSHHRHRVAVTGDRDALLAGLEALTAGEAPPAPPGVRLRPRLVWLVSGQGTHWMGMGLVLAERFDAFRDTLHRADTAYRALAGASLLNALSDSRALERTEVVQPAIAAVQIALAALLRSLGIVPDAVAGQSLGEVAAAAAAGCLSVEDAMTVVFHRARLMARTAGTGATAFVALPAAEAERLLCASGSALVVAGHTAPGACVVAGGAAEVEAALASLAARGVTCRRIADGGVAFHSPAMDPLLPELGRSLAGLEPRAGEVPFYSSLDGTLVLGQELGADYWCRNLRTPFSLPAVVDALTAGGAGTFLEVGPHPVLARPLIETLTASGHRARVLGTLARDAADEGPILTTLAALYEQGHPVEGLYPEPGPWVDLPLYPWQRDRFWVERGGDSPGSHGGRPRESGAHPLLGVRRDLATGDVAVVWEQRLAANTLHYLDDHRFLGSPVLPGAAILELAGAAGRALLGGREAGLREIRFHRLLHLDPGTGREVQLLARRHPGGFEITLASRADGGEGAWTVHATGLAEPGADGSDKPSPFDHGAVAARCPRGVSAEEHYARMGALGLAYGPAFQVVESLACGEGEVLARLRLPQELRQESGAYAIHPTLLDGALQALAWLGADGGGATLPAAVGRVGWHDTAGPELWCHATLVAGPDGSATGRGGALSAEVRLTDVAGRLVATLSAVELRPLGGTEAAGGSEEHWVYGVAWEAVDPPGARAVGTPETWIILADGDGVAEAVAGRLRVAGHNPVLVRPGDALAAPEGDAPWRVRPGSEEDFVAVLDGAAAEGAPACQRILHLWSLDAPEAGAPEAGKMDDEWLERAWELTCSSTLAIFRALSAHPGPRPRLWVVTRGAQEAVAGDPVAVGQAPAWGLARAVGHAEHPELWGGLVDLDPRAGAEAGGDREAVRLLAAVPGAEDLIALRGNAVLAPRLRRTPPVRQAAPAPLSPDATYLVTGGFGGLAGVAADWLVERGARRLLLVGRTPLPPREQWATLAAGDPMRGRVDAVRRLEARGVSVHTAAVDVADATALSRLLDRFQAEGWPPIRGVVHLAGVVCDRLALATGEADAAEVWRPKVLGAWLLHRLLGDRPLDFFVLFSSLAALVSRPGQSVYAGANSFLDALAHHRRGRGEPGLSIGWGPWGEVGMVARQGLGDELAAAGIELLYPDRGLELLHLLAGQDQSYAAVVAADWPGALPRLYPGGPPPLVAGLGGAAAPLRTVAEASDGADLWRTLGGEADLAERRRVLCGVLVGRAAKVLNLDPALLAPERPLAELGMDSIVAVELSSWVGQRFEVAIPVGEWLRGPSLEEIAGRIDGERFAGGGPVPVPTGPVLAATAGG
ncbi:MAG TPA: type I polyketide synthase [Longimicrobiaceae bacterium]